MCTENVSSLEGCCQELSEQTRTAKSRRYEMRKRAEQIDSTRKRIVEATVGMHGTVGPAQTTVAGIARAAGVTRLTVYRHFPDDDALFTACSEHWMSHQVMPDPSTWTGADDPVECVRAALSDLYRFYRDGAADGLTLIYRDKEALPPRHRRRLDDRDLRHVDVLASGFNAGRAADRRLRGLLAHAVSFWTWHSLCVESALTNEEAVVAMTALVAGAHPAGTTAHRASAGARPGRATRE
jgi:AcrR family transcriptional regulator